MPKTRKKAPNRTRKKSRELELDVQGHAANDLVLVAVLGARCASLIRRPNTSF